MNTQLKSNSRKKDHIPTDEELCKKWVQQTEDYGTGPTLHFKKQDLFTNQENELVAQFINEEVIFIRSHKDTVKIYELWIKMAIPENITRFNVVSFDDYSKNINEYKEIISWHIREAQEKGEIEKHFRACVEMMKTTLLYFKKLSLPPDEEILALQKTIASWDY